MVKLSADKAGKTRYFSAKLGWKERFDPREIDMLYAGDIPALLSPRTVQGRKNNVIQFDISPYATLEYYLSFPLSSERFSELLLSCADVFLHMQKRYLNMKNLVLELNKIYIQLNDRSVHFVYLPLMNSSREASLADFFSQVLASVSPSTHEISLFVEQCEVWLKRPAAFTLEEFKAFVVEHLGRGGEETPAERSAQSGPSVSRESRFYDPMKGASAQTPISKAPTVTPAPRPAVQTRPVEQKSGGGVPAPILAPGTHFYLLREKTGEQIEITFSPFWVGTDTRSVSYCVSGNVAVSRRHAMFTIQGDCCSVTDQGSTNKTYVNRSVLTPFSPQALREGDRLRLADEVFIFSCQKEN